MKKAQAKETWDVRPAVSLLLLVCVLAATAGAHPTQEQSTAKEHVQRGLNLSSKEDVEAAIAEYRAALSLDQNNFAAHYNLGNALRKKGDLDGAIAEYNAALWIDRNNAEAHYNLGTALDDKGDQGGALTEYRTAISLDPDEAGAHARLGLLLLRHNEFGDLGDVIVEYRDAHGYLHNFLLAHYGFTDSPSRKLSGEDEVSEGQMALQLDIKIAGLHTKFGPAGPAGLSEIGDEFRSALGADPNCAAAHYGLAAVFSLKSNLDGAIAEYRIALRLDPQMNHAHNNLGTELRRKGDLGAAEAEYRAALQLDPNAWRAHMNLGTVLFDKGDTDSAVSEFRRAVRLRPDLPVLHYSLGRGLEVKGDLDGALAEYRTTLSLKPNMATFEFADIGAGRVLLKKGNTEGSIKQFHSVLQENWMIRWTPGLTRYGPTWVWVNPGTFTEFGPARPVLNLYDAQVHFAFGEALESTGSLSEALKEYREAAKDDPEFELAKTKSASLAAKLGKN